MSLVCGSALTFPNAAVVLLKALCRFANWDSVTLLRVSLLNVYVFSGRHDHQEEKRRDPVSPGSRGLRSSSQLHLQVRRQVQQVGGAETILVKLLSVPTVMCVSHQSMSIKNIQSIEITFLNSPWCYGKGKNVYGDIYTYIYT